MYLNIYNFQKVFPLGAGKAGRREKKA